MGRTACTQPQCLYSRAITLLPLWAVRSVQSLGACTVELHLYSPYGPYELYRASVPVQYSYNSTPPMGRTACTEPQCLYSRPIPLLPLWAIRHVQSLSVCTRVHFTFTLHWISLLTEYISSGMYLPSPFARFEYFFFIWQWSYINVSHNGCSLNKTSVLQCLRAYTCLGVTYLKTAGDQVLHAFLFPQEKEH
jgi:hypothetical protein